MNCVAFNPDDRTLVSSSLDKTVKYWDLETFQLISSTKPDCQPPQLLKFSSDARATFAAYPDALKVYNLEKDAL